MDKDRCFAIPRACLTSHCFVNDCMSRLFRLLASSLTLSYSLPQFTNFCCLLFQHWSEVFILHWVLQVTAITVCKRSVWSRGPFSFPRGHGIATASRRCGKIVHGLEDGLLRTRSVKMGTCTAPCAGVFWCSFTISGFLGVIFIVSFGKIHPHGPQNLNFFHPQLQWVAAVRLFDIRHYHKLPSC